jgi:hypothetical protein
MKQFVCAVLLLATWSAYGEEPAAGADANAAESTAGFSSHGLIIQLQGFVQQRNINVDQLSIDAVVKLMVDWYRFSPIQKTRGVTGDALVYRYGGWSEGCATAFKLSVLRRVTVRDATGADAERMAGITMMFEPSGQSELVPFSAVSSDAKSIEAFVGAVENSPAFQQLAGAAPMGVLIEGGGLR